MTNLPATTSSLPAASGKLTIGDFEVEVGDWEPAGEDERKRRIHVRREDGLTNQVWQLESEAQDGTMPKHLADFIVANPPKSGE